MMIISVAAFQSLLARFKSALRRLFSRKLPMRAD
jgi:hypothetical protein